MIKLLFATNNQHKVDEIQSAIGDIIKVVGLRDAGIVIEIPEPHDSIELNAIEKARTISNLINGNCFSEDTGLEVEALHGDPGVKSARYAGDDSNEDRNISKLLDNMIGAPNRNAKFRTVICLIWSGKQVLFEGTCEGTILTAKRGTFGFGYDPVFIPNGSEQTLAEMPISEKNIYSHRKKAADKLVLFLQHEIIHPIA